MNYTVSRRLDNNVNMAEVGEVVFERGEDDSDDNDIWDDTALIKAYDDAVSDMKVKIAEQNGILPTELESAPEKTKKAKKRKNKNRNKKRKWKVGDRCRAVFTEDGVVYEAEIVSVDEARNTCQLRYLGYGNEEEQSLNDLMTTSGKGRKQKQSEAETDSGMEWSRNSPAPSQTPPSSTRGPVHSHSWPGFPPNSGMHYPRFPFPGAPPFPGFPMGPPHGGLSSRVPPIPPPPPPLTEDVMDGDNEALCSMLMSWYMSGYHTGYYQGLKQGQQKSRTSPYDAYVNR